MMILLNVSSEIIALTDEWMLVALSGALAVMAVLSIIYALAPLIGRNDFKLWVKIKIFDVIFSIALIFIFFFVLREIDSINFVKLLGVNVLVPSACGSIGSTDLTTLSMCDLNQFANYAGQFNIFTYLLQLFTSASSGYKLESNGNLISFSATISLSDLSFTQNFLFLTILYAFDILSRVLLLILAVSPLLLSIMVATGLLARIFPVTRTFGGAMIAFGFGVGVILPLILSLTYGYLDVGLQNIGSQLSISSIIDLAGSIILFAVDPVGGAILSGIMTSLTFELLLVFSSLVILGLAFVSVFDLIVVDVFIRDFSQAVGERLDFLSILSNVI